MDRFVHDAYLNNYNETIVSFYGNIINAKIGLFEMRLASPKM